MRFIHLSDLHLGKNVNCFSMIEDQAYILDQIVDIIKDEKPDGILIAGDVYDKSIPSAEAVELLNHFLERLVLDDWQGSKLFLISGNHDSAERLSFGRRFIARSGVHIAPSYNGKIKPICMEDEFGKINVFLLPFIKPIHVRRFFPDLEIDTYTQAIQLVIDSMKIDPEDRNILVTHQYVTGAERSDSEDLIVGGTSNIDASVFKPFDYVALGHLHRPQHCSVDTIRYCGTPLKYSFSEVNDTKSLTLVELGAKQAVSVREIPLTPKRELRQLRGTFQELMSESFYENTTYQNDYVHVTLTDEDDLIDGANKLRTVYPYLMKLDYDNARSRALQKLQAATDVELRQPIELFAELYEKQNGSPLSEVQRAYILDMFEKMTGGEV